MAISSTASKPFRLTGWHVLGMFGALFGVMLAVNVLFVVLALKTFSGETDHAYINGLKFNETLAAQARQDAMGWTMTLGLERPVSGDAIFEAKLVDKKGLPLVGAALSGTLARTTENKDDRALVFSETAPGIYRANIANLSPGRWRFAAKARVKGAPEFSTETTLSLR